MHGIGMYPGSKSIVPDTFFGSVAITGNAADDPTVFKGSMKRVISSVAQADTGIYTITFISGFTFPEVPNFVATVVSTVPEKLFAVISQEFSITARTLIVRIFADDGTATNLATTAKLVLMCHGRMTGGI